MTHKGGRVSGAIDRVHTLTVSRSGLSSLSESVSTLPRGANGNAKAACCVCTCTATLVRPMSTARREALPWHLQISDGYARSGVLQRPGTAT